MAKLRVQYDDGKALDIDVELPPLRPGEERTLEQETAILQELAWDQYKALTKSKDRPGGIRRRPVAEARGEIEPPKIEVIDNGTDGGTDHEP